MTANHLREIKYINNEECITPIITPIIITSAGGNGHTTAAKAMAEGLPKDSYSELNTFYVIPKESKKPSCLEMWGIDFGKDGVKKWNSAQKKGIDGLWRLHFMASIFSIRLSNWIFGKNFRKKFDDFLNARMTKQASHFNKKRVVTVIDTQTLFTEKTLACLQEKSQDKIKFKYKKVLTDFAEEGHHFLDSIRNIDFSKYPDVKIEISVPSKISRNLGDSYAYYQSKIPNLFNSQGMKYKHVTLDLSKPHGPVSNVFERPPEDGAQEDQKEEAQGTQVKNISIMLGSQASDATKEYLNRYIMKSRENPTKK